MNPKRRVKRTRRAGGIARWWACLLLPVVTVLAADPAVVSVHGPIVPFGDPPQRVFVLTIPPGSGFQGSGLAVDDGGNMYVSEFGVQFSGSVVMIPKDGRSPVRIMEGLDRPSDIEISPDGRSLVMAGPDGKVYRRYFGISIRIIFAGEQPMAPTVTIKTDQGAFTTTMSGDGYFHFPQALMPRQNRWVVDVVIQNGRRTIVKPAQVLQVIDNDLHGHSIIDITI